VGGRRGEGADGGFGGACEEVTFGEAWLLHYYIGLTESALDGLGKLYLATWMKISSYG
jgi:hypothetical protein